MCEAFGLPACLRTLFRPHLRVKRRWGFWFCQKVKMAGVVADNAITPAYDVDDTLIPGFSQFFAKHFSFCRILTLTL